MSGGWLNNQKKKFWIFFGRNHHNSSQYFEPSQTFLLLESPCGFRIPQPLEKTLAAEENVLSKAQDDAELAK